MTQVAVDRIQLKDLLGKGKAVVADFHADWCHPCHVIAPEFEALASRFSGEAEFVKVDVDATPELAADLGIMSIPTVVHFSATGEEVGRSVGAVRADELARRLSLQP